MVWPKYNKGKERIYIYLSNANNECEIKIRSQNAASKVLYKRTGGGKKLKTTTEYEKIICFFLKKGKKSFGLINIVHRKKK